MSERVFFFLLLNHFKRGGWGYCDPDGSLTGGQPAIATSSQPASAKSPQRCRARANTCLFHACGGLRCANQAEIMNGQLGILISLEN